MYYTRHERNMQDAFCNFLHMGSYRCGIHAAARHLVMDRSFAQRRRRSYRLQIHLSGLPKANKCRSCFSALVRKLFVRGDISEIRRSDIIIQANTPPCRIQQERGIRIIVVWWDYLGSNRRPLRCERSALTNWAIAPCDTTYYSTTWEIC